MLILFCFCQEDVVYATMISCENLKNNLKFFFISYTANYFIRLIKFCVCVLMTTALLCAAGSALCE